jgi:hypothetical protein
LGPQTRRRSRQPFRTSRYPRSVVGGWIWQHMVAPVLILLLVLASPIARAALAMRREKDGPELTALWAQRLATLALPGTEIGTVSAQSAGTALGKPVYAKLFRRLPVELGTDPATVLADAVRLATADEWVAPPDPPSLGSWVLHKTVDHARLQIGLSVQDIDGRPTLVMNLTHWGIRV